MAAISFTCLFLVLLLSAVASRGFIADASQVAQIGTLANVDGFTVGGVEHDHDDTGTLIVAWNKMLRGRKLGVENAVQREIMEVKEAKKPGANPSVGKCAHQWDGEPNGACKLSDRGDTKISSRNSGGNSYRSMNNQDIAYMGNKNSLLRVIRLSNTQGRRLGSHVSEAPPTEPETRGLSDAATEISTMLSKDYAHKARSRSPVHNYQPLDHKNADP